MKTLLGIVAALCMSASVASADELFGDWNDPDYDWTGFYAGVNVGHVSGETVNDAGLPDGPADNWFAGVHGGYRHQIDGIVIGLAVAAPLIAEETNYNLPGFGFLQEVRHKGTVRGSVQVGFPIGQVMPFVSAGLGAAWMEGRETINGTTSPWTPATHLIGTVGVGVNVALDENWVAGIVYNHIWTSNETYDCGPAVCGIVADIGLDANVVAFTFERRFSLPIP